MSILKGEPFRQFECIGGWKSLVDCVKTMGPESPMTKLVTDLTGLDPDEYFSVLPYEKGSAFLYYLEQLVGGPGMQPTVSNNLLLHTLVKRCNTNKNVQIMDVIFLFQLSLSHSLSTTSKAIVTSLSILRYSKLRLSTISPTSV